MGIGKKQPAFDPSNDPRWVWASDPKNDPDRIDYKSFIGKEYVLSIEEYPQIFTCRAIYEMEDRSVYVSNGYDFLLFNSIKTWIKTTYKN